MCVCAVQLNSNRNIKMHSNIRCLCYTMDYGFPMRPTDENQSEYIINTQVSKSLIKQWNQFDDNNVDDDEPKYIASKDKNKSNDDNSPPTVRSACPANSAVCIIFIFYIYQHLPAEWIILHNPATKRPERMEKNFCFFFLLFLFLFIFAMDERNITNNSA